MHLAKIMGNRPVFTPNGASVKTAKDWRNGESPGAASAKAAAMSHADANGFAVIVWPKSGNVSLYVSDAETGLVRRVRFT